MRSRSRLFPWAVAALIILGTVVATRLAARSATTPLLPAVLQGDCPPDGGYCLVATDYGRFWACVDGSGTFECKASGWDRLFTQGETMGFRHKGTAHGTVYYIGGHQGNSIAYASVQPTSGKVYAMPYYASRDGTVDSMSMRLTVNGGAGVLAAVAIYDSTSYNNIAPITPVAGSSVVLGGLSAGAPKTVSQAGNISGTAGVAVDANHITLDVGASYLDQYRDFSLVITDPNAIATTVRVTASTDATPTVLTYTPATSYIPDPNYTYALTFGTTLTGGKLYWVMYADTASDLGVAEPTYIGVDANNIPPLIDSGSLVSPAPGGLIRRAWAPPTPVLENPFADTVTADFVNVDFPAVFLHFAD